MNALNRFFSLRDRGSRRPDRKVGNRRRAIMRVEPLEGRQLLSTFTVTNTSDNSNAGSLRWAITQSNATGTGTNTIKFDIPSSSGTPLNDSGVGDYYQINLNSPLPAITRPVNINGNTETSETGAWSGYTPVEVVGSGITTSALGLDITANNTTVQGLSIVGFKGGGVEVSGVTGVTLNENWVGITPDQGSVGNTTFGVELTGGATNAVISDSVISANKGNGLVIDGSTHNEVEGNTIGLTPDGTDSEANQGDGVLLVSYAGYNTIGGTAVGQRNVISSNLNEGVEIGQGTQHNVVAGNIIGLDSSGSSFARGNGDNGVELDLGASDNTVGGSTAAALNVISGNVNNGVVITGSGTSQNVVEGNNIGTNITGSSSTDSGDGNSLGNGWDGVLVESSASFNTVGGTTAGARNLISGNAENGVALNDVSNVLVEGNDIGTDATGMKPLGNGADGVLVHAGASNVTIGGTVTGAGNLISGNGGDGVDLNSANEVSIKGNDIGTNKSGTLTAGMGNASYGVDVVDSSNIQIGAIGTDPSLAENTILGNGGMAIEVSGSTNVTVGKNVT